MNDNPTKHDATTDATPTVGLRCAWCATVLRQSVAYPNPDDHVAWTHGMCRGCQILFEDDAPRPAHAIRDTQKV